MVGTSGIEPPTTTMSRWCSTTELRAYRTTQIIPGLSIKAIPRMLVFSMGPVHVILNYPKFRCFIKMILSLLFILGITVEAITGAIAAGRKKVDCFGVILIACAAALGGGTVRDIMLNTYPLIWVSHPYFLLIAALAATLTMLFAPSIIRLMKLFLILDALGLATFAIIGTQKAISLSFPIGICVISGMLTGICGGMLRDILCNDIPLVLHKEIYAIIALIGSLLYWTLTFIGLPHYLTVTASIAVIFIIRVYAIIHHIEMPLFDYSAAIPTDKKTQKEQKN